MKLKKYDSILWQRYRITECEQIFLFGETLLYTVLVDFSKEQNKTKHQLIYLPNSSAYETCKNVRLKILTLFSYTQIANSNNIYLTVVCRLDDVNEMLDLIIDPVLRIQLTTKHKHMQNNFHNTIRYIYKRNMIPW